MKFKGGTAIAALCGLLAVMGAGVPLREVSADPFGSKHKGMSYAHEWRRAVQLGYGTDASHDSLRRLRALGVEWVSITPFGFQRTVADQSIRWGGSRFSESDARLEAVTRQAHALDLRVMLKPHIWLRPPPWVGQVHQQSESGWQAWFASYREFILHYAHLAQRTGIDAFCIGNELEGTTGRDTEWRSLIADVREVYRGPVTYGATTDEAERLTFWDALDAIGISAYYPLVNKPTPTRRELRAAWKPIVARLAALAARWRRPILFTEIGYPSADFGAWRQWEIGRDAPVNLAAQVAAYEAFFDAVWPQPWFAGAYWWKWFSDPAHGGPHDNSHPPQGKPAEDALRRAWGELKRGS